MEFIENLDELERMFEEHKKDNHNIQEFRQNVDDCIARQVSFMSLPTYLFQKLTLLLHARLIFLKYECRFLLYLLINLYHCH